jgi:exopolyphosphatase/guanosine-5'-triphosphate,3'-diphosphate pyrophosphatase
MTEAIHLGGDAAQVGIRTVAVIDIGSSSIRMAIAQIDGVGCVHPLESLQRAVKLGKDTWTNGSIGKEATEECVRVLFQFRRVLLEYGITDDDQVRAIATSAVREASNKAIFLDRIYSATGIEVDAIDEMEVNRLTYLAVMPLLTEVPAFRKKPALIVQVGAGSTELLLIENAVMTYAGTYRLGALRLYEMLETHHTSPGSALPVLISSIQRMLDDMYRTVQPVAEPRLLVLGGNIRFALSQMDPEVDRGEPCEVSVKDLEKFSAEILDYSVDELLQKYHLPVPDAETLGPALLSVVMLAKTFGAKSLYVATQTLRDGLLIEMSEARTWEDRIEEQVIKGAMDLGLKFRFDESHAVHVALLCISLFDQLQTVHRLDPRYRTMLHVAALLHEVGNVISTRSHHKHSMYLIMNSEIFGLSSREMQIVALVARYHRRAVPRATHEVYGTLTRDRRIIVNKLAAILRVADSLDRAHQQRISSVECILEDEAVILTSQEIDNPTLERMALKDKDDLFQQVYGMRIELRSHTRGNP